VGDALRRTGRGYAENTWRVVSRGIDAYVADWSATREEACEAATTARGPREREAARARLDCLEERRVELHGLVEALRSTTPATLDSAAPAAYLLTPVASCAHRATASTDPVGGPAAAAPAAREVLRTLGEAKALEDAGQLPRSIEAATRAETAARALSSPAILARVLLARGRLEDERGDPAAARPLLEQAGALATTAHADATLAAVATRLVHVETELERAEDASRFGEVAREAIERTGGDELLEAERLLYVGAEHERRDQWDEAKQDYEHALAVRQRRLGGGHPATWEAWDALGFVLGARGHVAEADAIFRQVLEHREKVLGHEHPLVALAVAHVADACFDHGQYEEAVPYYRRAEAIYQRLGLADGADFGRLERNFGWTLGALGRYEEAYKVQAEAIEILSRALGPEHRSVGTARYVLANLRREEGKLALARKEAESALAILAHAEGEGGMDYALALTEMAEVELAEARFMQALGRSEQAIRGLERALGEGSRYISYPLTTAGRAELGLGHIGRALPLLERALQARAAAKSDPRDTAETELALAEALWRGHGDRHRARELAEKAQQAYAASPLHIELAQANRWLTQHPVPPSSARRD
jgi:tetratricopeptide (TPR) repeat protein